MKNSFVIYTDYMVQIELLSLEQRGILLTAIMGYASGSELPEMDGMTKMAFSFIKARMDKDAEKYQQTVEKRREAGKLGGRPKADAIQKKQEKAKKANGFLEKQNNPDNEYDNDNVNDKDKNIMCEANALFERLWKQYPNKRGKGQVSDTQKKRLLSVGETELVKAIERYSSELKKDADWRKPQNGSTFFNSGYVDYLDANFVPGENQKPKKDTPKNQFNNFHQREYDYQKLEQQLLGR